MVRLSCTGPYTHQGKTGSKGKKKVLMTDLQYSMHFEGMSPQEV